MASNFDDRTALEPEPENTNFAGHLAGHSPLTEGPPDVIGRGQWMALAAAILGWLFDGLEMGLFPLVARPALLDLLGTSNEGRIGQWIGIMTAGFLVGAATGGVLFGWLGDRIGRVRAMMLSVLAYALFTGLCGFAQTAEQVFVFRFIAALGMGGEWSLGVSLVMEIWPNRSRAWLAGLIGAAANVGFVLIAVVSLGLTGFLESVDGGLRTIGLPERWVDSLLSNSGWRLLMIFGAAPALLTFFIRLFVPESERWLHQHSKGATSHWATRDLLGVLIGACGPLLAIYLWASASPFGLEGDAVRWVRISGTIFGLAVALVGYLYPVRRYLQRAAAADRDGATISKSTVGRMIIGAALSGIALLGTWGSLQWAAAWADQLTGGDLPSAKANTQIVLGIGAIIGTIAAAVVGKWLNRRVTYVLLCLLSLASILVFYQTNDSYGLRFLVTAFFAGGLTASFYGWLPLYLPELFSTNVRATGQGFAFNFGRIIAAIGALQTGYLMKDVFKDSYPMACSIMGSIYVLGIFVIWLAPETRGKPLPD